MSAECRLSSLRRSPLPDRRQGIHGGSGWGSVLPSPWTHPPSRLWLSDRRGYGQKSSAVGDGPENTRSVVQSHSDQGYPPPPPTP